jgi:hypothetical protein
MVNNEKMIADPIKGANITPHERHRPVGTGAALFEEHFVAQSLCFPNLLLGGGQSDFQGADSTERWRQSAQASSGPFRFRMTREEGNRAVESEGTLQAPHRNRISIWSGHLQLNQTA